MNGPDDPLTWSACRPCRQMSCCFVPVNTRSILTAASWCAAGTRRGRPQVFDLLVYLIRNRERVVSKDDLIEGVWGGRIVSNRRSPAASMPPAAPSATAAPSGPDPHRRAQGLRFVSL
jgi:hypothetical protein